MIIVLWGALGLIVLFGIAKAMALALRLRKRLTVLSAQIHQLEKEVRTASSLLIEMRGREIQQRGATQALNVRCFAQFHEEPVLWALLGYKKKGYYVEAGAYDGVRLSTSYFFESIGWTGLLVEANPELYEACRKARPGSKVVNAAIGGRDASGEIEFSKVAGADGVDALGFLKASDDHIALVKRQGGRVESMKVPFTNLSKLLDQERPGKIDFVVIDVEGFEETALEGLEIERWAPGVVMVERNPPDAPDNYAAAQLLQKHGYRLCARCIRNDVYISRDVRW